MSKDDLKTAYASAVLHAVPGAIDAYVVRINGQSWVGRYNGGTAIRLALGQVVTEADTDEDD